MAKRYIDKPAKGECGRCGVSCWAEFCRDCKKADPGFCKGGMSAKERAAYLRRLAAEEAAFHQWALEQYDSTVRNRRKKREMQDA